MSIGNKESDNDSRDVDTVNEGERVEDRENGEDVEVDLAQRFPLKGWVYLLLNAVLFHRDGVISIEPSLLDKVVRVPFEVLLGRVKGGHG